MFTVLSKIKEKGFEYIIHVTIPYYVQYIFEPLIKCVVLTLFRNAPLKDIIIIESHNDFDSHGGAFYEYLLKNGLNKKYKIVWFLRNKCPDHLPENVVGIRYNRLSIKRWYYYSCAKYIICGHLIIPSIKKGQISVYTTHGSFSLKQPKGYITLPKSHMFYLCASDNVGRSSAEQYGLDYPNNQQLILGFPAHDYLFENSNGNLSLVTTHHFDKTILWMPTFRKTDYGRNDTEHEYNMGIPIFQSIKDMHCINEILNQNNTLLIIKIHPMQDLREIKAEDMSNIRIIDGDYVKTKGIDNYRLMKDVDALISDYSSAASDFLLLDKPIAYTIDDLYDYKLEFVCDDPTRLMAGHLLKNTDDLKAFIIDVVNGKDVFVIKRKRVREFIFKYTDGYNCKRLADFLNL